MTLGHEHAVEAVTLGLFGFLQELAGKLGRTLGVRLRLFISAAVGVGHVTDGDHVHLLSGLLSYTFVRRCSQWADLPPRSYELLGLAETRPARASGPRHHKTPRAKMVAQPARLRVSVVRFAVRLALV